MINRHYFPTNLDFEKNAVWNPKAIKWEELESKEQLTALK